MSRGIARPSRHRSSKTEAEKQWASLLSAHFCAAADRGEVNPLRVRCRGVLASGATGPARPDDYTLAGPESMGSGPSGGLTTTWPALESVAITPSLPPISKWLDVATSCS